jgi:hypothetical protein
VRRAAAILLVIASVGCASPLAPTPPPVSHVEQWAAFGDSVTVGFGASAPSQSYIGLLGAELGAIDDLAVGATRMAQQADAAVQYAGPADEGSGSPATTTCAPARISRNCDARS